MLGQTFDFVDLTTIGVLVLLESALSIDNALILGLLAAKLPTNLQAKALSYGLVGAMAFRIVAVALASVILRWKVLGLAGAAYLILISIRHFVSQQPTHREALRTNGPVNFWSAVVGIELTDMAFAVDNVLAAVALIGPSPMPGIHPKLWVVLVGGMLGVISMRFAASIITRVLTRFPRFEAAGYLIVLLVGVKLLAEFIFDRGQVKQLDFENAHNWPFWVFWGAMLLCIAIGLIPSQVRSAANAVP